MNYREVHHHIVHQLSSLYAQHEVSEIAYRLLEEYCSMSKIDIALSTIDTLEINPQIEAALQRLTQGEPLQYVIGYADFYDLRFEVNPSVLIPRPETEELVALVLAQLPNKPVKILDIGTGSACIPISIKKNAPFVTVAACDISLRALAVAKNNATHNGVEIDFFHCDILNEQLHDQYDIIISNPPYVTPSEKEDMHRNVLDFEPHLALFVEEDNPLLFYERIANIGLDHLKEDGYLFFEINESFGKQITKMLKMKGYMHGEVYQDIFGKDRMLMAQAPRR